MQNDRNFVKNHHSSWHPFTMILCQHMTHERTGHALWSCTITTCDCLKLILSMIVVSRTSAPYLFAAFLAIFDPPLLHWPTNSLPRRTLAPNAMFFLLMVNPSTKTCGSKLRTTWGIPILGWHATLLGSISGFLDGHRISRPPIKWSQSKEVESRSTCLEGFGKWSEFKRWLLNETYIRVLENLRRLAMLSDLFVG